MPETRPQPPLARPPTEEVIRFIDGRNDRHSGKLVWGIEPIAKTLGIAPSTYHASKARLPPARAVCDAELVPVIARVHKENFGPVQSHSSAIGRLAHVTDRQRDNLAHGDIEAVVHCLGTYNSEDYPMSVTVIAASLGWSEEQVAVALELIGAHGLFTVMERFGYSRSDISDQAATLVAAYTPVYWYLLN